MGLGSHKVDRSELVTGDHIYFYCSAYVYSHHGIFVGENTVIHYNRQAEGSSSSTPRSSGLISSFFSSPILASLKMNRQSTCSNRRDCGLRRPGNGVVSSCLDCFIGNKKLRRYQYGVTQTEFKMKLRGGCTTAKPDPSQEVISRARYLLEVGFGDYNLGNNNCEDFALYCKTGLLLRNEVGLGSSGQINTVQALLTSVGDRPSPIESSLLYNSRRYSSDIGVRNDVEKVAVENVASFLIARHERCNSEPPKKNGDQSIV